MDILYHPETKYLDTYIEMADAIEMAFPSVMVRGNEKEEEEKTKRRNIFEWSFEIEQYSRREEEEDLHSRLKWKRSWRCWKSASRKRRRRCLVGMMEAAEGAGNSETNVVVRKSLSSFALFLSLPLAKSAPGKAKRLFPGKREREEEEELVVHVRDEKRALKK